MRGSALAVYLSPGTAHRAIGGSRLISSAEPKPSPLRTKTASKRYAGTKLPAIWDMFSEDATLQRLLLLAKMVERVTSRDLQRRFGMSVAQWRVLAFVCIAGPAAATDIGEAAEVDQGEISRAVKSLVEAGLATREFEPGSRKKRIIAPTPQGLDQFRRVRETRQAYFSRVTGGLTAVQRAQLNHALTQIAAEVVAEREGDR